MNFSLKYKPLKWWQLWRTDTRWMRPRLSFRFKWMRNLFFYVKATK